jgi:hypothetical protein
MVARTVLLFLLFVAPALALRPTILITLWGQDQAKVQTAKGYVDGKLAQHPGKVVLGSTSEVACNESGYYEFSVFVQLSGVAAAKAVKTELWSKRSLILKNLHGWVIVHLCPAEGELTDWQGCDRDSRSKYEEITF